jgi:hypothetical protein
MLLHSKVVLPLTITILTCASAGCRKSPPNGALPVASVAVTGSAVPTAGGTPSTSVSAMPTQSDPPKTLPAPPAGADPTRAAIAASICAAAYTDPDAKGKDVEVGCRSHPPFTKPEQKPDGMIVLHTGDPIAFCAIDAVYKGSFSKPDAREAIVSFRQCDGEGTWDSANPGSAVLVEEVSGGRFREIDYQAGVNIAPDRKTLPAGAGELRSAAGCDQIRRADGRDALFCVSNFGAFRLGAMTYFFVVDFAEKPHAQTVARIFEDIGPCLQFGMSSPEKDGLVSFQLGDRTVSDLNGDQMPDISVEITRSRATPSSALAARVKAACRNDSNVSVERLVPPGKKTTLQFLSDKDGWAASPTSKSTLHAWSAENGGFGGIGGAGPPDR